MDWPERMYSIFLTDSEFLLQTPTRCIDPHKDGQCDGGGGLWSCSGAPSLCFLITVKKESKWFCEGPFS